MAVENCIHKVNETRRGEFCTWLKSRDKEGAFGLARTAYQSIASFLRQQENFELVHRVFPLHIHNELNAPFQSSFPRSLCCCSQACTEERLCRCSLGQDQALFGFTSLCMFPSQSAYTLHLFTERLAWVFANVVSKAIYKSTDVYESLSLAP